jgi:hypothetical protein
MRKYVVIDGKTVIIKTRGKQITKTRVVSSKLVYNRKKDKQKWKKEM